MTSAIAQLPTVGTPATMCGYTDRHPLTVVKVSPSGKTITVQHDTATPAAGFDYYTNQVYDYTPNPDGRTFQARLGKDGQYRAGNSVVMIGHRRKFSDPSF